MRDAEKFLFMWVWWFCDPASRIPQLWSAGCGMKNFENIKIQNPASFVSFDGFVNLMVLNKMFFIINSTYCIFLYVGFHISPLLFPNFSNQFIGCLEENLQRNFHVVGKVVNQRKIPYENGINKKV